MLKSYIATNIPVIEHCIIKILLIGHLYHLYFTDIMVLEIEVNTDSVKKLEKFLGTGKYKDLVTNTKSFSRKLNEERKMRLPYVCGQVIKLYLLN